MILNQARPAALAVASGDLSPPTFGMTADGAFYSFEAQAGRPAAVPLLGRLPFATAMPILRAIQRFQADFAEREADIIALIDMQSRHAPDFVASAERAARLVLCEPDLFRRWGFDGREPMLVVIDPAARIMATTDVADPDSAARAALGHIAALSREPTRDDVLPAPVLLVPRIFERGFCDELIAHFESSAHAFGGMASIDSHGNVVHKIDEAKKHRHDLVLGPRDPLLSRVLTALVRSCVPEIKKAFHVDARHTDRILIARYDETGGYFRRHRDNAAPAVAFRQFALSVNLNAEDHEGGHLLFPEYNSRRYKPGTGAGVIFSCSLLHEAAPVTRGRRYVLLTFLHDAQAQAHWLQSAAGPHVATRLRVA
jgi:predicted 2-oxoglutarate/Fe(II)-dependent dioxygenase YbiX